MQLEISILSCQALVVLLLGVQGKDFLVVIQVGALLLLEATRVILEDQATLHQVTLGVEALQERLDLAILVGDPILPLKEATRHTGIPREGLEDIHRQVFPYPCFSFACCIDWCFKISLGD